MLTVEATNKLVSTFYTTDWWAFQANMFVGLSEEYVFKKWELFITSPVHFWASLDEHNQQAFVDWVNKRKSL